MPKKKKHRKKKEPVFRMCIDCRMKPAAPARTICYCCKSRKWDTKNPMRKAWHDLKNSARKRGVGFELSFEEFKEAISGTAYMEKRGRTENSLTIDRPREGEPYSRNNIRVIPKGDNSKKYWKHWRDQKQMDDALDAIARENTEPIVQDKDLPF